MSDQYQRYPERGQPRRSLPWQTTDSSRPPRSRSPPRQTYHEPDNYREADRYHDSPPRQVALVKLNTDFQNFRRQYDYPNSHEEQYYTQPHPPQTQTQSPRITRFDVPPPSVIDVDAWNPSAYANPVRQRRPSPYYGPPPSQPSQDRSSYSNDRSRSVNLRGTRESPILLDDYQDANVLCHNLLFKVDVELG